VRRTGAVPARAEVGLPDEAVVFCCFNHCYKILPDIFGGWMRILAGVDGSVLWLLEDDEMTSHNLRKEAAARGVAPERLIFAPRVPHGEHLKDLQPLLFVFLSYVLSFVYVGIYWNNHHHLLQACTRVSGAILWSNLHLLFWLSLFPFATGWMGENEFAAIPTALYGFVLLMAAIAYVILQQAIIRAQGDESILKRAIGSDWKGRLSPLLYVASIAIAFWQPAVAEALLVIVALIWLIPDRRIESVLSEVQE